MNATLQGPLCQRPRQMKTWLDIGVLVENENALERGGWIGFSEDDVKPVAAGANTRPRRRIFNQLVEDNPFHLGYFA
jgi:hypothetical protein